jgi:hypothetical protein
MGLNFGSVVFEFDFTRRFTVAVVAPSGNQRPVCRVGTEANDGLRCRVESWKSAGKS